jgi:hypothetical protein
MRVGWARSRNLVTQALASAQRLDAEDDRRLDQVRSLLADAAKALA